MNAPTFKGWIHHMSNIANEIQCSHRSSLEEVPPPSSHHSSPETEVRHYWKFTVKVQRSGKWNCPIPDDKGTCPGRPPVCVFPRRLISPKVLEGEAVVTERFLLLPLSGDCVPGQVHSVLFTSKKSL